MLPEPTEKTLQELIKSIKTQKLDIGLSNDGDADRFAIIDSEGLMYSPNQILAILTSKRPVLPTRIFFKKNCIQDLSNEVQSGHSVNKI